MKNQNQAHADHIKTPINTQGKGASGKLRTGAGEVVKSANAPAAQPAAGQVKAEEESLHDRLLAKLLAKDCLDYASILAEIHKGSGATGAEETMTVRLSDYLGVLAEARRTGLRGEELEGIHKRLRELDREIMAARALIRGLLRGWLDAVRPNGTPDEMVYWDHERLAERVDLTGKVLAVEDYIMELKRGARVDASRAGG